jgi:hypothetical protein
MSSEPASFNPLYELSDQALLEEVVSLASRQRHSTVALIVAIGEVEARELYKPQGFGSMSTYCMRVLRMSRDEAFLRMLAARLARPFPSVLTRLAEGSLTLTNLKRLSAYLTAGNYERLLDAAACKTSEEVDSIVALLKAGPGGPRLFKVECEISETAWTQLGKLRDLMRHKIPDGDVSKIVECSLGLLLSHVEKRKFAKVDFPRAPKEPSRPDGRYLPAATRREVAERDGYRCTFVGPHGRCTETAFLEFHHKLAFAKGGTNDPSNIELRCRAHNQYEVEVDFAGRGQRPKRRVAKAALAPTGSETTAPQTASRGSPST